MQVLKEKAQNPVRVADDCYAMTLTDDPTFVVNEIHFLCSACAKPTQVYHLVPRERADDRKVVVMHKLCRDCFRDTDGGAA